MAIPAFYLDMQRHGTDIPLQIQPPSIDSLEPKYPCHGAEVLYNNFSVGSTNPLWTQHLDASSALFASLDEISNVPPKDVGFHQSWDHYYDNLSARQCHAKLLPCSASNSSLCIAEEQADTVYRLGQYEYSYIYRASPHSLDAAVASYGVYVAELSQNIRDALSGSANIKYKHNVAHDGSIARLLSILQVDVMVWPGMGSEIVFEVYRTQGNAAETGGEFIRVLWGGQALRSSNPGLGLLDMVPLNQLLAYFDGLVGVNAERVVDMCKS
jgi:hypothetical protein